MMIDTEDRALFFQPPKPNIPTRYRPCTFCASSNISFGYVGQPARQMYVLCLTCNAQGPTIDCNPYQVTLNTMDDLMLKWTYRPERIAQEAAALRRLRKPHQWFHRVYLLS